MLGCLPDAQPTDVLELVDSEGSVWRFNLSFMASNWKCLYGEGCVGIHHVDSPTYTRDGGCCTKGAWFTDPEDVEHTQRMVSLLTDADWDIELRKYVEKHGWMVTLGGDKYDEDGKVIQVNRKTRVHDGICVFGNRIGGSTGKPGCAFHALAQRIETSHVHTKPEVCWQLPLRVEHNDEGGKDITAWDRVQWGGVNDGPEGEQQWLNWWCIDSPDAYVGAVPVYDYLREELIATCGQEVYDLLVEEMLKRDGNYISPMAGEVWNEGRPLLPLIIESKMPER